MSLALICRDTRRSPSESLEISDKLTAFSFDAACSYVLQTHENKREAARLKAELMGIAAILGADISKMENQTDDDDDVL